VKFLGLFEISTLRFSVEIHLKSIASSGFRIGFLEYLPKITWSYSYSVSPLSKSSL